jgi:hypothetical protein
MIQWQRITAPDSNATLQDILNKPDVLAAFETLIVNGLLVIPQRSTIFCAYCGEHICYDERVNTDSVTRITPKESTLTQKAVTEHRKSCFTYQQATASGTLAEDETTG